MSEISKKEKYKILIYTGMSNCCTRIKKFELSIKLLKKAL